MEINPPSTAVFDGASPALVINVEMEKRKFERMQ